MGYLQIVEVFLMSAIVAYLATPFLIIVARKTGYMDHPQDNKVHAHPTPLLGGIAIFASFLITIMTKEQVISLTAAKAILAGSFVLLIVGLIDDRMGMEPTFKLLGQFLAAMIIIKSGFRVEFLKNYYFNVVFTYLWIIGITNSFNFLDNMNGLSAGIAVISASFFGIISYMNNQFAVSVISFALAGSAAGFLKHNFPKARIFMGDSGSLVLGYVLASLSIMGTWKSDALTTSLMIPILILGYPVFDTALVTILRIKEKRSIFQGGKDHSSHRIALLGFKRYKTVLIVYGICLFLGLIALAVATLKWRIGLALGIFAFILLTLLGVGLSFIDTKRYGRKKGMDEQAF